MNGYTGQIKGPFAANAELFSQIKAMCVADATDIAHLGIQAEVSSMVSINSEDIEIGKTGIYEVRDTHINSIKFKQDMDENTIIDFVLNPVEGD